MPQVRVRVRGGPCMPAMTIRELRAKVEDLERKVRDLEAVPKAVILDVPPKWVLQAARAGLNKTGNWEGYYDVLTNFYGIHSLNAVIDTTLDQGIAAQYDARYLINPTVQCRTKTMSDNTAIHEFFHHLFYSTRHKHEGEGEQRLADAFAIECLRREKE